MKKAVLLAFVLASVLTIQAPAQQGGAFVGSLGLGITSAQGDFAALDMAAAGGGVGFEAQIRFYPFSGFGIGPIANYMRFGSSYETQNGTLSYNFSQIGGVARLNLFGVRGGALFINGGGGMFTPNAHHYIPDESFDESAEETGNFFFGGVGLTSFPTRKVTYELEIRYSVGTADFTYDRTTKDVWDFIYAGVRVSFASKGENGPPRY